MKKPKPILNRFTREVFVPALKLIISQPTRETNDAIIGRIIQAQARKAQETNQIRFSKGLTNTRLVSNDPTYEQIPQILPWKPTQRNLP